MNCPCPLLLSRFMEILASPKWEKDCSYHSTQYPPTIGPVFRHSILDKKLKKSWDSVQIHTSLVILKKSQLMLNIMKRGWEKARLVPVITEASVEGLQGTHPPPNREQIRFARVRKGKTIIHIKLSVCGGKDNLLGVCCLFLPCGSQGSKGHPAWWQASSPTDLPPWLYHIWINIYLVPFVFKAVKQLLGVPWYGPFFDQV